MTPSIRASFERRFRTRVLVPGAIIVLITAVLCGAGLIAAGRGTDSMSLMAQQAEVFLASSSGMDNLAVAQESVGMCQQCIAEARSEQPDAAWLDTNVAERMFDLFGVQETYILDGQDRPVYASVGRNHAAPASYRRIASAVDRFVKLARGEINRPSGRSNLDERLPGSPPAPLVLPPQPGFTDQPTTLFPTVRTTPSVIHATDLARIGNRIAFVSVMQMARFAPGRSRTATPAPVLVSIRYLDAGYLSQIAKQDYLAGAHLRPSCDRAKQSRR